MTGKQQEQSEMRNMGIQCLAVLAGSALILTQPAMAASGAASVEAATAAFAGEPADTGASATDAELTEARGGIIWFYYAVVGTTAVLRTCSKVNCVRIGVTAFNSISSARRYICQRKPRLRIC